MIFYTVTMCHPKRGILVSICLDGSVHHGSVRGDEQDFAKDHGLVLSVTYAEKSIWRSWMVQKPTIPECVVNVTGTEWTGSNIV